MGAETLATLATLNLVLSITDLPSKDESNKGHGYLYGEEKATSLFLVWYRI